jgi:hypothetical protein
MQGFDLFDRVVYFRLYQRIIETIAASAPPVPPIDAPSGAAPASAA